MDEVGEGELVEAGRAGRVLDCADGLRRRSVDAALVRLCCHELKDQIDPRGIRLRGAKVTGSLDLAALDVPFPLCFRDCEFEEAPNVEGSQLFEFTLDGCVRLPGLLANGLRVRHDLNLSRSAITGGHKTTASTSKRAAIWLCEADIGGRLLCDDTVIHADGERAIQADRIHVGGSIRFLHQFSARGEIRLLGARIDGSLDLTGVHLAAFSGPALDLGDAVIGGSLFLIADVSGRRPRIEGRIDMGSTRIAGQLLVRGAIISAAGKTPTNSGYSRSRASGTAISAPRLLVGAEVTFEEACRIEGGIDLTMSDISSLTIGPDCTFHAGGNTAINLTNAELRSSLTLHNGCTVNGTLELVSSRIHGNLTLQGVTFQESNERSAIAAQGVVVDGDVELQNLHATGSRLNFRGAALGSVLDAAGARLSNPDGYTISLHQATVKGNVRLVDGFDSDGAVILNRATIDGRLQCTNGSFTCSGPSARNPNGHAIEMISAAIRGGIDLGWKSIPPSVDFTNTTTTFLADDPARWPSYFTISGLTYDRFERPQGSSTTRTWDATARCAWLARLPVYDASPYEQAARVFRQHGYGRQAEQILITQGRHARTAITGTGVTFRRALNTAFRVTVGYGYRPERTLWMLAALLLLVIVSLEIPPAQTAMRATSASGVIYTPQGPLSVASTSSVSPPASGRSSASAKTADACGDGQVRCFNPVFYAVDTVIPLISLDQRSTWYPDSHGTVGNFMQWWLDIATLLGWLLSSVFVLSLARLARSP